jgi:hypothetical protein
MRPGSFLGEQPGCARHALQAGNGLKFRFHGLRESASEFPREDAERKTRIPN